MCVGICVSKEGDGEREEKIKKTIIKEKKKKCEEKRRNISQQKICI